jgi:Ca2+-binding RTX toxin-like protein
VVTWTSAGGVYAQRYDASGAAQGSEFLVNTSIADTLFPHIAALADGGFVITWTAYGQDGSGYGIYAQRYDAVGSVQGDEFLVNTTTDSDQYELTVTALADGGFVIAWTSFGQDGSGYGIYAQRYDGLGAVRGGEFLVNTTTASAQVNPTIAALADGGFVIAWTAYGQDGSGNGIYAQRYDGLGAAQGGEFLVNTTTASEQVNPTIAALADGGFVIAWTAYGQDGSGYGIYAQRYDGSGAAQGGEFLVNSTATSDQHGPAITALADGGFVIAWTSVFQDGNGEGIYAQAYDGSGVAKGGEFLINTFTDNDQFEPTIAAHAEGGFVIAWTSNGQDGDNLGVYASAFLPENNSSPMLDHAIPDQSSNEDAPWSWQLPANTFSDIDGNLLTYSAALGNGNPLPPWLAFDTATRTISGTPPANFNGQIDIKIVASDGSLSASDAFQLTIVPVNDAPTAISLQNGQLSIPEGGLTKVGDLVVGDDGMGTNALSLSGADAAFFKIIGSALYFNGADYEATPNKHSFAVTVSANDATVLGSTPVSSALVVTLTDVAENKTFNGTNKIDVVAIDTLSVDNWMISGGNQNDILTGGGGNDRIDGGNQNDILKGGAGNDILIGGSGIDTLTGGLGRDTFIFGQTSDSGLGANADHITDFNALVDLIDLSLIDANISAKSKGDQSFNFIGMGAFDGTAGELRYDVIAGSAHLYGDVNGDKKADFEIILDGVSALPTNPLDFLIL